MEQLIREFGLDGTFFYIFGCFFFFTWGMRVFLFHPFLKLHAARLLKTVELKQQAMQFQKQAQHQDDQRIQALTEYREHMQKNFQQKQIAFKKTCEEQLHQEEQLANEQVSQVLQDIVHEKAQLTTLLNEDIEKMSLLVVKKISNVL